MQVALVPGSKWKYYATSYYFFHFFACPVRKKKENLQRFERLSLFVLRRMLARVQQRIECPSVTRPALFCTARRCLTPDIISSDDYLFVPRIRRHHEHETTCVQESPQSHRQSAPTIGSPLKFHWGSETTKNPRDSGGCKDHLMDDRDQFS